MKLTKKESTQIVRSLLNLVYYDRVINSITRGEILPFTAAYAMFGVAPEEGLILDEDLDVADFLGFIYNLSLRHKGTRESFKYAKSTLESHYIKKPSIKHIYLSLKCFDLTPSGASRVLDRIGTYTDEKLMVSYLQFAINEFYINCNANLELDLTLSEFRLLWNQTINDYEYYYKISNELYYYI